MVLKMSALARTRSNDGHSWQATLTSYLRALQRRYRASAGAHSDTRVRMEVTPSSHGVDLPQAIAAHLFARLPPANPTPASQFEVWTL
jgi:hypothetical protein